MNGVQAYPRWALEWMRDWLIGGGPLLDGRDCDAEPDAGLWRARLQALLDDRYEDLAGADAALCAATGMARTTDAELWRAVRQVLRAEVLAGIGRRDATAVARAGLKTGPASKTRATHDRRKKLTKTLELRLEESGRAAYASKDEMITALGAIRQGNEFVVPRSIGKPAIIKKSVFHRDLNAIFEQLRAK